MKIIDDDDDDDDDNNNKRVYPNPRSGQRAYLNWLVRTGRYTVWRGKSLKATATSLKFRLLDWRAGYLNWSLVQYRPL